MKEVEVGKRPATDVKQDVVTGRSNPEEGEVPDGHDPWFGAGRLVSMVEMDLSRGKDGLPVRSATNRHN